ncbi:transforming growth factor-beta-induced protein ig-h3-like [Oratosquilla oratoria]|uniref:transforming growth factor-beta-induced protein ig-h3-like n=1 Tax=Oratosquilla oratoria TaxID=337810 RepID=UPI003F76DF7E
MSSMNRATWSGLGQKEGNVKLVLSQRVTTMKFTTLHLHLLLLALALSSSAASAKLQSLAQTARDNGLTTFAELVDKAKLSDLFGITGPFTVFAPTNDAFANLESNEMEALTADSTRLRNVLFNHLIAGRIYTLDLGRDNGLQTLQGGQLSIHKLSGEKLPVVNGANIVQEDIEASNGLLHAVDKVLLVPSGDIITVLSQDPEQRFSTFLTVVQVTDLADVIKQEGPLTVFVPTNKAFTKFAAGHIKKLLHHTRSLARILKGHVVPEIFYSSDIPRTVSALNKAMLHTFAGSHGNRVASPSGDASIIEADLMATNGVIHVIDDVL